MPDFREPSSLLKERGIRATRVRTGVVRVLGEFGHAASAPEILGRLKRSGIRCNKTTVYRDLELFERVGLVRRTSFRDGLARYELSSDAHHHHLVCVSCARVEDVSLDVSEAELEKAGARVYRRNGFRILDHMLELFGLCHACDTKKTN